MFKLGIMVGKERDHLQQLYSESNQDPSAGEDYSSSKLQRFQ